MVVSETKSHCDC